MEVVRVGAHEWTSSNLNVGHFRNGDAITHAQDWRSWMEAGQQEAPAWCYYVSSSLDASADEGKKYGRLYNGFAVNDPRGLAPDGWTIPDQDQLTSMLLEINGNQTEVDGSNVYFSDAGKLLKDGPEWGGEDRHGFRALPGGFRKVYCQEFDGAGSQGFWWSSSRDGAGNGVYLTVSTSFDYSWMPERYQSGDSVMLRVLAPESGMSVRCFREGC